MTSADAVPVAVAVEPGRIPDRLRKLVKIHCVVSVVALIAPIVAGYSIPVIGEWMWTLALGQSLLSQQFTLILIWLALAAGTRRWKRRVFFCSVLFFFAAPQLTQVILFILPRAGAAGGVATLGSGLMVLGMTALFSVLGGCVYGGIGIFVLRLCGRFLGRIEQVDEKSAETEKFQFSIYAAMKWTLFAAIALAPIQFLQPYLTEDGDPTNFSGEPAVALMLFAVNPLLKLALILATVWALLSFGALSTRITVLVVAALSLPILVIASAGAFGLSAGVLTGVISWQATSALMWLLVAVPTFLVIRRAGYGLVRPKSA